MTPTPPDPRAPEPGWNQPGGLGIKERRSWATWQLAAGIVVAAILGMVIGHSGGGSGSAGASGGGSTARTLPPDLPSATVGGTPTTLKTNTGPTTIAKSGRSTTTVVGAVTTTVAGGSTTTTAPIGNPSYLIHNREGSGPVTLPTFSIAGGSWTIGWAYRCVLAPGGAAKFQILAGAVAAVDEQGREGSGTTPQARAGRQQLQIVTDPMCAWAVTVVGVAG